METCSWADAHITSCSQSQRTAQQRQHCYIRLYYIWIVNCNHEKPNRKDPQSTTRLHCRPHPSSIRRCRSNLGIQWSIGPTHPRDCMVRASYTFLGAVFFARWIVQLDAHIKEEKIEFFPKQSNRCQQLEVAVDHEEQTGLCETPKGIAMQATGKDYDACKWKKKER